MILDFLKIRKKCSHPKVPIFASECYCPDCGELVENSWFICRCKCCGIKRRCFLRFGKIQPEEKFCTNCGGSNYEIIKLEKADFTNFHYAILKKETKQNPVKKIIQLQTWVVPPLSLVYNRT